MDPSYANADRGPAVVSVSFVFLALSAIIIALRLYTRLAIVRSAGTEDVLIAGAWICCAVSVAFTVEEVKYGTGRHQPTLSLEYIQGGLKMLYLYIPFYRLAITLVHSSIVLQYLRIFPAHLWIRPLCLVYLALIVGYGIASIVASILSCIPIKGFWEITMNPKDVSCYNKTPLWFCNAVWSIIVDTALIITPTPILNSLQLPRRQKFALMGVFAVGSFACITSILRLQSLYVITHTDDITWANADAAIWSNVEVNTGIICACLPPLKPLFMRFFPRLMSSTVAATTRGGTYAGGTNVHMDESELLSRNPTTTRIYAKMPDTDDERPTSQDTFDQRQANKKDITVTSEFTVH